MPLNGNLADFPLGDIIQLLNNTKKTGSLELVAGGDFSGETGKINFSKGKIISAASNKGLFGKSAFLHFYEWHEGNFSFVEMSIEGEVNIEESTESLLVEGARVITEWAKISGVIKSLSLVVNLAPAPPEGVSEIKFSREEWKILRTVDGKKTIREIADELKLADFEVSKIIYGLIASGLVEKVKEVGTISGVELSVKIKPEFYLIEEAVYIDSQLLEKWKTQYELKTIGKIVLHLAGAKDVIINVKPKNNLKGLILIPEEISSELGLKEKDKIFVEPLK